jgi:hypothetical protein
LTNSGEVSLSPVVLIAPGLNPAAAGVAASLSKHLIAGDTGDWFRYFGFVEAINHGSAAASHAAAAATNVVVEIGGLINLSSEALVTHTSRFSQ